MPRNNHVSRFSGPPFVSAFTMDRIGVRPIPPATNTIGVRLARSTQKAPPGAFTSMMSSS